MQSAPALAPTAPPLTTPLTARANRPPRQARAARPQPRPIVAEPATTPATKPAASRSSWGWVRPVAGIAILGFLLWRVGTGPFLDGLRLIDMNALAAALALGVVTTVCCAWRWSLVAAGLGLRLPLGNAVADCYRSVFLNATLPGGVLGDVHRAVSHGRDAGDVGRGVRAVVWERTAGQLVQFALAVVVLFALPSPVRSSMPVVAAIGTVGLVGAFFLLRWLRRGAVSRWVRPLRTAKADIRDGLLAGGNGVRILMASTVIVAGHIATFVVAARTAGSVAPLAQLVPLTLLALLAMGLPMNVGGFGPREGVAAWAFAAAGLTASQGVACAVVYGALVLVASLPGAAVLLMQRVRVPAETAGDDVRHG